MHEVIGGVIPSNCNVKFNLTILVPFSSSTNQIMAKTMRFDRAVPFVPYGQSTVVSGCWPRADPERENRDSSACKNFWPTYLSRSQYKIKRFHAFYILA